jgi:MoaA/NifB/PqqE/SkfB family radical SAM enzyme
MDKLPLRELRLELLQKCTLACVHCSAESSPSANRSLAKDLVIRLLNEGVALGLKSVVFTGGEPLIEPNLTQYITEASTLRVRSTVFTAGYLKTPASVGRIHDIARAGLGQINVSLYSNDPTTNARITRKPDSLLLSQAVLKAGVKHGLATEIHYVPMGPNIADLESVARWAANNGVSRLSILKYVPQGRGRLAYDVLAPAPTDELRLRGRIEAIIAEHPNLKVHVGPSFGFLGLTDVSSCEAGFSTLSVRSDGLAFPCDAFKGIPDSEFLRGSSSRRDLTMRPLAEVWQSCPYLCATRDFINRGTKDDAIRCAQGCPSQSIYQKAR